MSTANAGTHPPEPSPTPIWHSLLAAVITACPSTPSPNAPWVWGFVIVVVVLLPRSEVLKQHFA